MFAAGLALVRTEDLPPSVDGAAVLVLAAMGSFATSDDDPHCWAGPAAIGRRARLSAKTVRDRCRVLADAGAIVAVGGGANTGRPTRWQLVALAKGGTPAGHTPVGDTPAGQGGYPSRARGVPQQGNNRPESSRVARDDDAGPSVPGSAGAPPVPPVPGPLVEEVARRRSCSHADAAAWIASRLAAATSPVRSVPAYVRRCLDAAPASPSPAPVDEVAERRRRRGTTLAERRALVARIAAGEATPESVAAGLGVQVATVAGWVRSGGVG